MSYSIIYRSKAKMGLTSTQIEIMLIKAKRFNNQNKITGCIIQNNDEFIQIIEGEKADITNLYSKIKADKRHYDVTTLIETQSDAMLWDQWSMAFYRFTKEAKRDGQNKMLLESYFNRVSEPKRASIVFTTLKKNVSDLLSNI